MHILWGGGHVIKIQLIFITEQILQQQFTVYFAVFCTVTPCILVDGWNSSSGLHLQNLSGEINNCSVIKFTAFYEVLRFTTLLTTALNDPIVNYFNQLHNNASTLILSKNFHLDFRLGGSGIHSRSQKCVTYSKLSNVRIIRR